MISKSFLKSSLVFTISGALPMFGALLLLPFYANRLSELHYTQVQFYISLSLLLQVVFSFTIESYFGIKYTQLTGEPARQRKFIGTMSILLLLIGVGVLVICSIFGHFAFSKIFNPDFEMQFWPYGFYSVITAFFNSYFKAATNALIYLKRPGIHLTAGVINFIFTVGISIGGLLLFPGTIIGPIYGRLISGIIIFLIAQGIFQRNGEFVFEKSFLKDMLAFCTPYFFYAMSAWILGQIDRYMLQSWISKADLNSYDLLLKCFFGIEFVQNSLSAIIFPKVYEIWNKQERLRTTTESNRYFNVFTAINIIQLILFCIAVPVLYHLIIKNSSFYDSEKYIGIIAAGYALRSILNFYLATILFTKNTLILLKIFGVSALFQIVITYFFIGLFGLMGAIYASLITKGLQVLLSVLFTRSIFHYEYNYFKILLIPVLFILFNLLQYHFSGAYRYDLYLLQFLIFAILFFLLFRNEIRIVTKQYLKI